MPPLDSAIFRSVCRLGTEQVGIADGRGRAGTELTSASWVLEVPAAVCTYAAVRFARNRRKKAPAGVC